MASKRIPIQSLFQVYFIGFGMPSPILLKPLNRHPVLLFPPLFLAAFLFLVPCVWGDAGKMPPTRVGVVVSMNIRPYFEAMEGIREVFGEQPNIEIGTYFLEDSDGDWAGTSKQIRSEAPGAVIAIGPEATRLVFSEFQKGIRAYSMVLHPEKLLESSEVERCGVSLQVPLGRQIRLFRRTFPEVRRIGLLFDPANHGPSGFPVLEFEEERAEVIPLPVRGREDIPEVLQESWPGIDGLWFIPDRTVITESLVRYITKEAIANGVAVLGYNRFFFESGAAMAFVLDYREIGIKTARMVLEKMEGGNCDSHSPPFRTWINARVASALNLRFVGGDLPNVEVRP